MKKFLIALAILAILYAPADALKNSERMDFPDELRKICGRDKQEFVVLFVHQINTTNKNYIEQAVRITSENLRVQCPNLRFETIEKPSKAIEYIIFSIIDDRGYGMDAFSWKQTNMLFGMKVDMSNHGIRK